MRAIKEIESTYQTIRIAKDVFGIVGRLAFLFGLIFLFVLIFGCTTTKETIKQDKTFLQDSTSIKDSTVIVINPHRFDLETKSNVRSRNDSLTSKFVDSLLKLIDVDFVTDTVITENDGITKRHIKTKTNTKTHDTEVSSEQVTPDTTTKHYNKSDNRNIKLNQNSETKTEIKSSPWTYWLAGAFVALIIGICFFIIRIIK